MSDDNADKLDAIRGSAPPQVVLKYLLNKAAQLQDVKAATLQSALRFDAGKPELHHIHPSVWVNMVFNKHKLSGMSLFRMNVFMDCWFYKNQLRHYDLTRSPYFNDMCSVLSFGARKYAVLNYAKGLKYCRVLNSFRRHLLALANGETVDSESGLPHAGHALCNVLFAKTYSTLGYDGGEFDDRPKLGGNP